MTFSKKRHPERLDSIKPKKTFSYMDMDRQRAENNEDADDLIETIQIHKTDYRRINGTKSSSARVWIDTLNRLNSLVTMQYADSINELIMTMLDDFEDRLDDHERQYQELLLKMYNSKKK